MFSVLSVVKNNFKTTTEVTEKEEKNLEPPAATGVGTVDASSNAYRNAGGHATIKGSSITIGDSVGDGTGYSVRTYTANKNRGAGDILLQSPGDITLAGYLDTRGTSSGYAEKYSGDVTINGSGTITADTTAGYVAGYIMNC